MPKRMTSVADRFAIEGRGVVVVLNHLDDWTLETDEKVHKHEVISIRGEEGREITTFIKQLGSVRRSDGGPHMTILLPKNVKENDIAKGDEVFLARNGLEPMIWDGHPPAITRKDNA